MRRSAVQRRNLLVGSLATGAIISGSPLASHAGPAAPAFLVDHWLNGSALDVASFQGKVGLVTFWTYSCINALRTLPYLRRWNEEYGPAGLQIVGVHTPEFAFEHLRPYVEHAVRELDVRFAVGMDNGYRTWRSWQNRAWPSFYVLDRNARIVMFREGEGHSAEMEGSIRRLLNLSPTVAQRQPPDDADLSHVRSPEVYFGALRSTPQEPGQSPRWGDAVYSFSQSGPRLNYYELDGHWARDRETLTLRSSHGRLRMRYSAAKVHFVAGAESGVVLQIIRSGDSQHEIRVARPTLYTIVNGDTYGEHVVEVQVTSPGLVLYSATFG
jgi:thiol-disulfide isomerase/thioredoxin